MRILVGCEESQAVTIELRKLGHEAYSCDIQDCSGGHPEWHFKEDIFDVIKKHKWDMLIAFPPCTDLAVSGAAHFKRKIADGSQAKSIQFFMNLVNCDIPKIAIENPIGIMSNKYKKPTQIVQPYFFGDSYKKSTCLWLKNLPKLEPTNIVEPIFVEYNSKKNKNGKSKYSFMGTISTSNNNLKAKLIRSKTPTGLAKAMATQWTNINITNYPMKLKKTKTFSVSKNTDTVVLEGIEYPIANLLKSGIVNQTIVLIGYDELWHEIDVLNLGGDNSDLTNFKNFVELANLKLSDLIPLKKSEPKNYDVTYDDHVALSQEFPQFDYIKIGKLCSYYGKKSSVYILRQDLRICTERNLTIEQWIEQMENLNKKTMDNINRSRDRIIQLGKIGFKQNAKKEFEFDGFIVTQNSVDNDTDEVWDSFLSMVPTPTNQIDIETVINEESAPLPATPVKKPVSLETIGSLTPDRITDLSGLTEQQHEIVKQNPFIAVTDKKTLETAKKQRAVLLKASTAIDSTSGIQATAKKYLNTFKATLDNFLSSTAKITREAYDKQNAEIVKFENAEALRVAEEQRLKVEKINNRTTRLFDIPMVFNGTVYQIGTLYILPSQIETTTDEEFNLLVNQAVAIKNALDAAAEIEKNKDAEIAELKRKLAELTGTPVATPVVNNVPIETANYIPSVPAATPITVNNIPVPVSDVPSSQTAAPATNNRFKASPDYFMPTPENIILNRFDLDHVELIQAEPINPAFIKCRAYFFEGNRKVAEQIQLILNDTDVTVKKSVRINELCEILLNQPC